MALISTQLLCMSMIESRSLAVPEARESAFAIVDAGIGRPDPNISSAARPELDGHGELEPSLRRWSFAMELEFDRWLSIGSINVKDTVIAGVANRIHNFTSLWPRRGLIDCDS